MRLVAIFLFCVGSISEGKSLVKNKLDSEPLVTSPKAKVKDIEIFIKNSKSTSSTWLALETSKAEVAKTQKEFYLAAKIYSEVLARFDGETGKAALQEYFAAKLNLSKDKALEFKKAVAYLKTVHAKKKIPLFQTSKTITDEQMAPYAKWLGLTTESKTTSAETQESPIKPPTGFPTNDPLLSELIRNRCSSIVHEDSETRAAWDKWAKEIGSGVELYVNGMIASCKGLNSSAEDNLKKMMNEAQMAEKLPNLRLTGIRQLAFLQRRSPSRFASIETYKELAKLWNEGKFNTENLGLDSTEIAYQKSSDLAWACRVSTWKSLYSEAEDYCEGSIDVALDWLEKSENRDSAKYSGFTELVAEGYQTIADRIKTEQGDWSDAKSVIEKALKKDIQYNKTWKYKLSWYLAFYTWLAGDFKEAETLFLKSFENSESKSDVERGLFWAARAAKSSGNLEGYRSHLSRLKGEFPFSYYSLVAIPNLEEVPPKINNLNQISLSKRMVFENDLNKILNKPQDLALKSNFQMLGVLIMFDIQPWATYLARDIHEQVKKRSNPKLEPDLWTLSAKALLAAGDPSKAMSVASLMTQSVKDLFESRPEMLFYVYPKPWLEHYEASAKSEEVSISTLLAISRQESTFSPDIVSPAKAVGLMQLIVPTADRMAKLKGLKLKDTFEELQQPSLNIRLGTAYLALLTKRYSGNETYAIAAYNAGEAMIDLWIKNRKLPDLLAWIEAIPFGETRTYVKTVLRNKAVYELQAMFKGAGKVDTPRFILGIKDHSLHQPDKL